MKLAKLSLAAIMTVGALTTVSAANLEDSIKGVDFTGMVRYRYNNIELGDTDKASANDWDFLGKFTVPVTEDIKFIGAFASSNAQNANKTSNGITTEEVDLRKMFFVYNKNALTIKAGQMALGTPVTDNGFNGQKGNGVAGMYNVGGVTLIGAYFSGVNYVDIDADDASAPTASGVDTGTSTTTSPYYKALNDRDVMAIAAVGSMGPVNAQLWVLKVQDFIDAMVFAQVDGSVAGVNLMGQYVYTKVTEDIANAVSRTTDGEDTGNFFALKAGYSMDAFSVNLGYTKTDDMPVHSLAAPGDSAIIVGGWRTTYNYAQISDTEVMFADASVKMGPVTGTLGYAATDIGERTTDDGVAEIYGQVAYPYSKNLTTYVKYSDINDDIDVNDQKYFRFEAKYTF